jgi:hypothetical protein
MPNTRVDRELLETYQDGKAILKITEQELKSKYEKTDQVILENIHRFKLIY